VFNLNLGYNWGKYKLRLGIENLLDKDPPVYGTNPGVDTNSDATQPGFYDTLGRRYYVGVKASF
jgi:outer membrane receptor protein involved in Fe transport